MDLAAYEAAGLYDPRAANAEERRALLEWLAAQGIGLPELEACGGDPAALKWIAGDRVLMPLNGITLAELARRAQLPIDRVQAIRLAAGLPPLPPEAAVFSPDSVPAFSAFAEAAELFGEAAVEQFVRVIGSALARLAEGALALFLVRLEAPSRATETTELSLAQTNLRATESLARIPEVLRGLFLDHVRTAIQRVREARPGTTASTLQLAIGFVDLVGFTPLGLSRSLQELAEVVERFEATAHEVATLRNGRVVKLVGDEVMFAAVDPAAACDIALTLVERLCCGLPVAPRGGIAYGEVLLRGGDYYGPVVNLAARIAELAVPTELLVTPEVARSAAEARGIRFEPAGKRLPKGHDVPVTLFALERA